MFRINVKMICFVPPQERDGFGGALGPRGRGRGRADWNMAPGGLQEVTYTIPADKCGLVIGKGSVFLCVLCCAILWQDSATGEDLPR